MEAFSKDLKSVTADFSQSVTDANGEKRDASHGTLALQAPRQFRWETKQPYQQTIVADGQRVWVYDPDLQQVSVRSQSGEEAHSPLTVLTDLGQLDSQFTTSESGERDGLSWLKLVSRAKEPEFEYAELGFSAKTLDRMVFKDQLGNTTEIRFDGWKRNPLASGRHVQVHAAERRRRDRQHRSRRRGLSGQGLNGRASGQHGVDDGVV